MDLKNKVYQYKTKYPEGFTNSEVHELLKEFPTIDMDKFNNALRGNTCTTIDNETIQYHVDIYKALLCGIEKRDLTKEEWD